MRIKTFTFTLTLHYNPNVWKVQNYLSVGSSASLYKPLVPVLLLKGLDYNQDYLSIDWSDVSKERGLTLNNADGSDGSDEAEI